LDSQDNSRHLSCLRYPNVNLNARKLTLSVARGARMRTAGILLAASQILLVEALTKLLEPEFEVVGMVAGGREFLPTAIELKPDLVVLDVSMSGLNGLEAGRSIKANLPETRLIYLTLNEDGDVVDEAFRLGASAYLLKNCSASDFLGAGRGVWVYTAYLS